MEYALQLPLSVLDLTKIIAASLFTLIIFFSICKLLIYGDENDSLKKVLGGFGVFLFAIIANTNWVYVPALFIGGLLIASEKFLLTLASVFRAEGSQIPAIVNSFFPLTSAEIEEKHKTEAKVLAKESSKILEKSDKYPPSAQTNVQSLERLDKLAQVIKNVETLALRQIRLLSIPGLARRHYSIKEYVEILLDKNTKRRFDALFVKNNSNEILAAFDIKYFPKMDVSQFKVFVGNAQLSLSDKYATYFFVVFGDYVHQACDELIQVKREITKQNPNMKIVLFHLQKDSLEPINTEDIIG